MAKSLRSKWVRKCKRVKRVRYGKKELASLVAMVEKASKTGVVVKDAAQVVREKPQKIKPAEPAGEDNMEMTSSSGASEPAATLKTLIKNTGTAPRWLHPRRLKKTKAMQKINKFIKAGKKNNKKYLG
ncbi:Protein LLP [Chionoecetes opilio]|uniref:Protein LLP n=1 Tax=Chionoecetes opilio TaxID=41210 RepID=A0A8J4Y2A8_CHIOP|nr:Protein LLP [Chionoecetes opilio]